MYRTIVVGSRNPVKLAAVSNVANRLWSGITVSGVTVNPGIGVQPLSDDEAIQGATNRAQLALAATAADLAVGLEGNTVETPYGLFSTGWAVVIDQQGRSGLGSSGRLPLPAVVATAIRQGRELGPLMDELIGEENIKQRQGAVGVLTHGLMDRTKALECAVLYAFAPFLHPFYLVTSAGEQGAHSASAGK